jgi:hypothetical protein
VVSSEGGMATLNFQGEIERCYKKHDSVKVNEVYMSTNGANEMAYAATSCEPKQGKKGK